MIQRGCPLYQDIPTRINQQQGKQRYMLYLQDREGHAHEKTSSGMRTTGVSAILLIGY
jgi:hypothetical protein